jgi:cobalt-zinc-cadmium efflux system outer membrane protein
MFYARLSCVWAAVVLGGITVVAQTTRPMTVDELVDIAFQRNRDFLAAKQRLTEAQGLLRQAGIRPAPTIEVDGSTGRPVGTVGEEEFAVGYFRPIETAGKRDKRIQVAQRNVDLAQAEIAERERQLAFDVRTRYVEAASEERKLQVLGRVLGTGQEYFRLTSSRVDRGDAARLEADLFAADLSRTEAQQIVSRGRAESAVVELKQAIGLLASENVTIATGINVAELNLSLNELQERAKSERPDLRIATLFVDQAEAELQLAKAESHPDVTASAQFSHRKSQFEAFGVTAQGTTTPLRDVDNILKFGLSVPLFSQKRNEGNIQAAQARLTAAQLRRDHVAATVQSEVEAAFRRWTSARRALEILKTGVVDRSEKNLQVIRQAYSLGQLRIFDVLNEQRRVLDLELSLIDAQADATKAFAELERSIGGTLK